MPQQDTLSAITQIKKTHENFMVSLGVLIGTLLVVYFFTYGALVDSVTSSLIWFEVITSILMVLVLLFLRQVCFFLTKLKLGRNVKYRAVLASIRVADLTLDEHAIVERLK